jgi:hypothetical protein
MPISPEPAASSGHHGTAQGGELSGLVGLRDLERHSITPYGAERMLRQSSRERQGENTKKSQSDKLVDFSGRGAYHEPQKEAFYVAA